MASTLYILDKYWIETNINIKSSFWSCNISYLIEGLFVVSPHAKKLEHIWTLIVSRMIVCIIIEMSFLILCFRAS